MSGKPGNKAMNNSVAGPHSSLSWIEELANCGPFVQLKNDRDQRRTRNPVTRLDRGIILGKDQWERWDHGQRDSRGWWWGVIEFMSRDKGDRLKIQKKWDRRGTHFAGRDCRSWSYDVETRECISTCRRMAVIPGRNYCVELKVKGWSGGEITKIIGIGIMAKDGHCFRARGNV